MVAWLKFGNGETPRISGIKGDHLVGKYYVKFDEQYRKEVSELINQGLSERGSKKIISYFKKGSEDVAKMGA